MSSINKIAPIKVNVASPVSRPSGPSKFALDLKSELRGIYGPLAVSHGMRISIAVVHDQRRGEALFSVILEAMVARQVGKLTMEEAASGKSPVTLAQDFLGPLAQKLNRGGHLNEAAGTVTGGFYCFKLEAKIDSPALQTTILNPGDKVVINGKVVTD